MSENWWTAEDAERAREKDGVSGDLSVPAIFAAARMIERDADLCFHCGAAPEEDGDHTCPCPLSDAECLEKGDGADDSD